jgi:hypothetical protein
MVPEDGTALAGKRERNLNLKKKIGRRAKKKLPCD